jgi:hypothetical protein
MHIWAGTIAVTEQVAAVYARVGNKLVALMGPHAADLNVAENPIEAFRRLCKRQKAKSRREIISVVRTACAAFAAELSQAGAIDRADGRRGDR